MSLKTFFRLPVVLVASVFGTGYLPTWSRHWSAFMAVLISMLMMSFDSRLKGVDLFLAIFELPPGVALIFGYDMLVAAMHTLWACAGFGWLFLHVCDEKAENFTLDTVLAQFLVFSLGLPAIMAIAVPILPEVAVVMENYLVATRWLTALVLLILLYGVPYGTLRIFDMLEFWPAGRLRVRYPHSVMVQIASAFSSTFYTLFALYAVAMLFFGLSLAVIVAVLKDLFANLWVHLGNCGALLFFLFGAEGWLYSKLVQLGLVDVVSNAVTGEGGNPAS